MKYTYPKHIIKKRKIHIIPIAKWEGIGDIPASK